jgi:hypothetical protein
MSRREQIRQRANRLRSVPLESVLRIRGASPDRYDKQKWHTARGALSINGGKFFIWECATGGGGAIDLVIALEGRSFREALDWLHEHFPQHRTLEEVADSPPYALVLPLPNPVNLSRVRSYLLGQRALPAALIDPLIGSGSLYADGRANAVFLLGGQNGTAVGAELRGTGSHQWRGMAPGSRKDHGFFCVPTPPVDRGDDRRPIILCESAIDAISCLALHPGHWCISTSGARPNPVWLSGLIARSPARLIFCGFDADDTGNAMAHAMIALHPEVQRLRPAAHDWNALLQG